MFVNKLTGEPDELSVRLARFFTGVFDMKKHLFLLACFLLLSSSTVVSGEVVGDFDGDGKTDLTVRRLNHSDFRLYWYTLNSRHNQFSQAQWGYDPGDHSISDLPALGDYDGDGKTDIAVFRVPLADYRTVPTYFFILRSSDSTMRAEQLGLNGDTKIPQDYDGDGKTDAAVARVENGITTWYILQSRDGYRIMSISVPGYPVRGDFDGDGKADCALMRRTSGVQAFWHIHKSSTDSLEIIQFGRTEADYYVPGDYDGDGKTDLAIWRGKSITTQGLWIWRRSSDGNWGTARLGTGFTLGDFPVPGDYDGDGKTDPAIWRRATEVGQQSYFYILGSRHGFYGVPWGTFLDDVPLFYLQTP
jgi:hypothetical protein